MRSSNLLTLLVLGGIGYYLFVGKHETGSGDPGGLSISLPARIPSDLRDSIPGSPIRISSAGSNSRYSTPATSWNLWAKRQIEDKAAAGAIVDIPTAGSKIPSRMRIEAQSLVAKRLNLPDSIYSVAQPARQSLIQSLLRR